MKTSRIASGALAVALAFGAAACDADGTADDGVGGVEDPLDTGTTTDDGLTDDTGTTTDTGTTGTDG